MGEKNFSRRKILQQLGTAGTVSVGASAGATATENEKHRGGRNVVEEGYKYKDRYDQRGKRQKAVQKHAKDTLHELFDRGIIDRPSHTVFDLDTEISYDPKADDEVDGWIVEEYPTEENILTAHIFVSKTNEEYNLTLHVRPQSEDSYATVKPKDGGQEFLIDPSEENVKLTKTNPDGVGVQDICSDKEECTDMKCEQGQKGPRGTYYIRYTRVLKTCYSVGSRCSCATHGTECACECQGILCGF